MHAYKDLYLSVYLHIRIINAFAIGIANSRTSSYLAPAYATDRFYLLARIGIRKDHHSLESLSAFQQKKHTTNGENVLREISTRKKKLGTPTR